jgi:hypothetical protein
MADEIINIVPNVTGFVDLLGFNSYLDLGENDLRTDVGKIVVKRLNILKDAVSKIESEKVSHPEVYPSKLLIKRITDSIIISSDIDKSFLPAVGRKYEGGFSYDTLKRFTKEIDDCGYQGITYGERAVRDIGFIIGCIARVHEYINSCEHKLHFPGCRTTIALGLRQVSNDNKEEDLISANFAFSLAWKLNEKG